MRSVTSCFNSTVYWKTMTRFWPLWALYALIWAFLIPLNLLNAYFNGSSWGYGPSADMNLWIFRQAMEIPGLLRFGVFFALGFGVLCAMAVFGYLYSSRSACMMHSLPLRREGLFLTQYLAGLSFMFLPHLAVAVLAAASELIVLPTAQWGPALYALGVWFLGQSAVSLFFFSFAAFCAMFTGHILALPVFYGILNVLAYGLYTLISTILSSFFYGYTANSAMENFVLYLTPAAILHDACYWWAEIDGDRFTVQGFEPWTVAAYAVVGLLLAAAALLVYRRRHVESAGDVVAIPLVRPLFKYGVAFCSGIAFGSVTAAFFGWGSSMSLSLCVIVWSLVGCFIAQMFLKKSFRVLNSWRSAAVFTAIMAVLCLGISLDLFGIETRVPALDQVRYLTVQGDFGFPSDSAYLSLDISDPDQLQKFLDLHHAIVDDRDRGDHGSSGYFSGEEYVYLTLNYHLTGGGTLERRYSAVPLHMDELETEGSVTWAYNRLLQDRDLVRKCYNFDRIDSGRLVEAYLSYVRLLDDKSGGLDDYYLKRSSQDDLELLWQAVLQDFEEGTIGVRYLFDTDAHRNENTYFSDLNFSWEGVDRDGDSFTAHWDITLTPNAKHTMDWLREMTPMDQEYELVRRSEL